MRSDSIGDWYDVGTLTPSSVWALYPNGTIPGSLYAFTYTADWETWNRDYSKQSIGHLRFNYLGSTAQYDTVGDITLLYPKPEIELRLIPTYPQIAGNIFLGKVPSIRRVPRYPRSTSEMPDSEILDILLPWTLKIEYLL